MDGSQYPIVRLDAIIRRAQRDARKARRAATIFVVIAFAAAAGNVAVLLWHLP